MTDTSGFANSDLSAVLEEFHTRFEQNDRYNGDEGQTVAKQAWARVTQQEEMNTLPTRDRQVFDAAFRDALRLLLEGGYGDSTAAHSSIRGSDALLLDQLDLVDAALPEEQATSRQWVRFVRLLQSELQARIQPRVPLEYISAAQATAQQVAANAGSYASDSERARQDARHAAEDARAAAKEAQQAATAAGAVELRKEFDAYGSDHLTRAFRFRVATIALLVVVAVLATGFLFSLERFLPFAPDIATDDWHTVVFRVSVLAAFAAISAYLGRQASHHRRMGDWAVSVAVQLGSFVSFIQSIPEAHTKNEIYEAFARRVLGAPPEAGKSQDVDASVLTSMLEIALKNRAP